MKDKQAHLDMGTTDAHADEHAGHHGHHAAVAEHTGDEQHESRDHADHSAHAGHGGHAGHSGHSGHAGHGDHVGQFRRLFWIMLALAVPVVGFNEMFAHLLGYHLPDAEWVWWVSPILGTVVYAWGGWLFLTGAVSEVRSRKPLSLIHI